VSNVMNYYSVTDNIFQLIVDFWHMLLVNDDDDVGFSLAFFVRLCYVLHFLKIFLFNFCVCACGCVHDKLAQYAFILLQYVTSLMTSAAFLLACHTCTYINKIIVCMYVTLHVGKYD